MNQDQIITVLYDLALTVCGETRVKPLLTKMTQRLLYHTAFPCGFFFSCSDQKNDSSRSSAINTVIETALCSRKLNLSEGQSIKIAHIFCGSDSTLITDKELIDMYFPGNEKYDTALILPVSGHGSFVLLSQTNQIQALPLTRIFTPILDNFSKTLSLCKQNEQFTNMLEKEIDERKKAHKELLKAKNDAEQANQAKSTFLSRMSHELRTPMNAILGFSQLLNLEEISQQQHQFTNEIIKAGNHLLDLINDILDLSKIESGNINISMEELDLNKIIAECLPLVSPLAKNNNISIDNQLNQTMDLCIRADFTRTKQVTLNLLSNAIKYNRNNGSVCIRAEHIGSETLRVNIIDTGSGIAHEDEKKLFSPFERLHATNTAIEGTGIGLNISKRLIEAMNGQIGYQNNPPENSTFWFELKRCKAPRGFSNTTDKNNDNAIINNNPTHTILYVEDNPANLRLMERIIEMRAGAKLISTHTAAMGIDMARHHLPEIILMDISLPDNMDGFQALHTLQRLPETKKIPVIAISANAMPREIEKGKQAGFYDYLAKPVDISQLNKLLDQLLCRQNTIQRDSQH